MKLVRLYNYEYWPYYFFYIPMYFYGLYLAAKSRSFTYFTTTNPCMKHGGIMGESKYKILQLIPGEFIPKSILVRCGLSYAKLCEIVEKEELQFPVIAKPDIGERGKKVEKISSIDDLFIYSKELNREFILQEFVDFSYEAGILYYRFPNNEKGKISSIVTKDFLYVQGDGQQSLKKLIIKNVRAFPRKKYLFNKFSSCLDDVIAAGEKFYLEPIGNHNRGTTFLNGNGLINEKLTKTFDQIAQSIPGFYYGRFDIKAKSEMDLIRGENFRILELNGVSSEQGHIYDPKYKLIQAYKDIANHMKVIFEISNINYKSGVSRTPLITFIKDLVTHFRRN